jgi:hypothetical protein
MSKPGLSPELFVAAAETVRRQGAPLSPGAQLKEPPGQGDFICYERFTLLRTADGIVSVVQDPE